MSITEVNAQSISFSKIDNSFSSSSSSSIFEILSRSKFQRTPQDKKILFDLLNQIQAIKHTFKNSTDYKALIEQCSDHIEACTFRRGSPLVLQGDKCQDLFIILNGTVNIYEQKGNEEVEKQKEDVQEAVAKDMAPKLKKNPTLRSTNSILVPKMSRQESMSGRRRPGAPEKNVPAVAATNGTVSTQKNLCSIEDLSEEEAVDNLPSIEDHSPEEKGFTRKRIMKIKSIVAFMKFKGGETIEEEEGAQFLRYLPKAEQLLYENEVCQKKYFKDGACLMNLKGKGEAGFIINENCLMQVLRSSVTIVAKETVQCVRFNRDVFRELVKEEIQEIDDKKEFFWEFFQKANQNAVLNILEYVQKKKFRMHETVYTQGEKSKGLFIIKSGEVRLLMNMKEKTKSSNEDEEANNNNVQNPLFLPHQQKGVKKKQVTAVIVTQGDFFGEEDAVLNLHSRKYTAMSCATDLVAYHIPNKFYPTIAMCCPEIFRVLKERATHRNHYIEEKIKSAEIIKDQISKSLQGMPSPTKQEGQASKRNSSILFAQNIASPEMKNTKTRSSMVLLLKKKDEIQQTNEGSLPNHFPVVRGKREMDEKNLSDGFKTWSGPESKGKVMSPERKPDSKNFEDKKSMNQVAIDNSPSSISPTYAGSRLFAQEKNNRKNFSYRKIAKNQQGKSYKTMTGLNKEEVFSPGFKNLISNRIQKNSESGSLSHFLPLPTSDSNQNYQIGPQFHVKSYTHKNSPSVNGSPKSTFYELRSITEIGDKTTSTRNGSTARPLSHNRFSHLFVNSPSSFRSLGVERASSPNFSSSVERLNSAQRKRPPTAASAFAQVNNIHMKNKATNEEMKREITKQEARKIAVATLVSLEQLNRSSEIRVETEPCTSQAPTTSNPRRVASGLQKFRNMTGSRLNFMAHKL